MSESKHTPVTMIYIVNPTSGRVTDQKGNDACPEAMLRQIDRARKEYRVLWENMTSTVAQRDDLLAENERLELSNQSHRAEIVALRGTNDDLRGRDWRLRGLIDHMMEGFELSQRGSYENQLRTALAETKVKP